MKKLTIILAAAAIFFTTASFTASGPEVSSTVQIAFQNDFARALDVTWERTDEFYFASFNLDRHRVTAGYDEEGTLLGTSRDIDLGEIPLNVARSLRKNFDKYRIHLFATEVMFEGETFYFITAESDTKIYRLKCFTNGHVFIDKKVKKYT